MSTRRHRLSRVDGLSIVLSLVLLFEAALSPIPAAAAPLLTDAESLSSSPHAAPSEPGTTDLASRLTSSVLVPSDAGQQLPRPQGPKLSEVQSGPLRTNWGPQLAHFVSSRPSDVRTLVGSLSSTACR